jgi:RimJ/RimL family protein N-acetyltransferase
MSSSAPRAPGFATPRLGIEPLDAAHAGGLSAVYASPGVERFLHGPSLAAVDAMRARIAHLLAGPPDAAAERWWNFAVRLRAGGAIIGQLEATTYGAAGERAGRDAWGEIAYVFGSPWWGLGLAGEATRWLVDHLAGHGVGELWASVDPTNHASRRLLLRTGFAAVDGPGRPLGSYDPGDAVFRRG